MRHLIIFACLAWSWPGDLQAQSIDQASHSLEVVIDGSQNPESVPDELAYRHFILALLNDPSSVSSDNPRWQALVATLRLADEDKRLVASVILAARPRLLDISRGLADPTLSDSDALRAEQSVALDLVKAQLDQSLSQAAATALLAHVRTYVKARIVIYGHR
jgi:hypothetical protein